MARKTIVECDRCGKSDRHLQFAELNITVGTGLDAAGDTDTVNEQLDLCMVCLTNSVSQFVSLLPMSERKAWIRATKTRV